MIVRRVRPYLGVVPVSGLVAAGALKQLPVLSASPVDITVLFTAACAGQVFMRLVVRQAPVPRSAPLLALIFGVLGMGVVLGPENSYGVAKAAQLFASTAVACFASVVVVRSTQELRNLLRVLAAIGVVVAVVALARQSDILITSWTRLGIREGGSPLSLGRWAALAVTLYTVRYMLTPRDERAGSQTRFLLAVIPAGIAAILSVSQGPLAGSALAIIVVAAFCRPRKLSMARTFGVILAMGAAAWIGVASAGDFRSSALTSFSASSEGARFEVYRKTVRALGEVPLGVGFGGFGSVVDVPWEIGADGKTYPHNIVLEVAIEAGLLAAVALVAWVFVAFRRAWSLRRTDPVYPELLAALVYFGMNAMVSSDINGNAAFLVLVGVAVGLGRARSISVDALQPTRRAVGRAPSEAKSSAVAFVDPGRSR